MVAEGHLLVNHTDDHRSFTGYSTQTRPLTSAQRTAELSGAEAAVTAAGRTEDGTVVPAPVRGPGRRRAA